MRALVQDGNVVHRALPPDLEDDVVPVVQAMPSYLCVHVACDDGRQMRDVELTAMDALLLNSSNRPMLQRKTCEPT
jgi:hypothetical protein